MLPDHSKRRAGVLPEFEIATPLVLAVLVIGGTALVKVCFF